MSPYFDWGNLSLLARSPSGHLSPQAQLLYKWLYANYYGSIPAERVTDLWSGPIYLFGFIAVLAISLWVYTRMANAHRRRGELYGVESFGGVILERIGPIDAFTFVISAMCFFWAAYFFIAQILFGNVY